MFFSTLSRPPSGNPLDSVRIKNDQVFLKVQNSGSRKSPKVLHKKASETKVNYKIKSVKVHIVCKSKGICQQ